MPINIQKTKEAFNSYVDSCKEDLRHVSYFSEDDKVLGRNKKIEYVKNGDFGGFDELFSDKDAIRLHRTKMMDSKLVHTADVEEGVIKSAKKMNMPEDFNKILQTSALLHDIGRFPQAIVCNDFVEKHFREGKINIPGVTNHSQYGYYLLKELGHIYDYNLPLEFQEPIMQATLHHGDPKLPDEYMKQISNVKELSLNTNYDIELITSVAIQLVRDVDKLDILHQHLTGQFPVIRKDFSYKFKEDVSLDEIAKTWGISKEIILEFNSLDSENDFKERVNALVLEGKKPSILIPTLYLEPAYIKKLAIPEDIRNAFKAKENFSEGKYSLNSLMARDDWYFPTGMWWRLSHFLQGINFAGNLWHVLDTKLLDRVYETYPNEYKPLVEEAFMFAKKHFLEEPLKEAEQTNSIYTRKLIK